MTNKYKALALLLVAALLLPLFGQAAEQYYNIQQLKEQAAKGWTKTYESRGRTIEVDVAPRLPEVENLPLLEVGRGTATITLPADDTRWQINRNNHYGFLIDYKLPSDEEPAGYVYIDGKRHTAKPYSSFYPQSYAMENTPIPSNPLTFKEIADLMEKAVAIAGLPADTIDVSHPYQIMTHAYYGKTDTDFVAPGWGAFTWDIHVRGIPCFNSSLVPFDQGSNEPSLWTTSMSMVIRRPDLFWVGGDVVLVKQELEGDLPLMSFDQVKAGYEQLIEAGKVRHVYDLTFGYALQPKPGMSTKELYSEQGIFYAKPFWRLECLWEADPKAAHNGVYTEGNGPYPDPRNSNSRVSLLMDAQTGDILNPTSTKVDSKSGQVLVSFQRDRAVFKGVKTWAEVDGK